MNFLLNMSLRNGQPGYIAYQSEIESNSLIDISFPVFPGHPFSFLHWSCLLNSILLPPPRFYFTSVLLLIESNLPFFWVFYLQPHMAAHTFCLRIIVFRRQGHDKQQAVLLIFFFFFRFQYS